MLKRLGKLLLVALVLIASGLYAQKSNLIEKRYMVDENGNKITMRKVAGYPPAVLPVSDYTPPKTMQKGIFFALDNVPGYDWAYGCTATATAMLAAYYDHHGVVNAYTGPLGPLAPATNATWNSQASTTGTSENPIAGTNNGVDGRDKNGHSDDYWTNYGDEATDPYYGAWAEHTYYENDTYSACTADYMGTNQWYNWENSDGSTSIWSSPGGVYDYVGSEASTPALRDGIHGLRLFWEALGYTVDLNYTRTITGYNDPDDDPDLGPATGGFTFEMYMNEIDQGLPVIVQIEGHSMTGYGYDNTDELNPKVIVRDTWSYDVSDTHVMPWGGLYSNMQHYAISVIHLGTESGWFAPQNVLALNNNRTVTVTWDDPSKGTVADIEYEVYRDDVLQATVSTESFQEVFTATGDGLHTYYVKTVYPSVPYTTLASMSSSVIVCASVTEFHDDFESGDGQWMLNDGWGLDTDYKISGTYSLSESPGGNYVDNTDQLPMGGSVGEIAPGLNFSAAADASVDFWFRYDIELSFDYMHLQTCKDGINWVSIKVWDGETPAWAQENISLGLYAGESNVRIRFLFISDPGYNTEGSNIDDINIMPSATDLAPPYVFYSKEKDYYDNNPEGFEITSDITDFTGIDYASVIYSVNGGGSQSVSAWQILGDTYYFTIPEQTPGDHVEFWFDCQDTAPASNQSTSVHHEYYAGLHQKFDDGIVSYYSELVTTTAQYDYVAHANKCYSFHEDIVGVVIRGYDDVSQPDDNSDMMIHVWADNGGLPGADVITPLQVPNPATLAETNKWAYIDLSGYPALTDYTGDYYIGITCATGGPSDVTRTTSGAPSEYQGYDYGKAYLQLYMENGSALTWEKETGTLYHVRAVTTNYQLTPGVIVANPNPLDESLPLDDTASDNLTLTNEGGFDYTYNAVYEYLTWPGMKAKADVTVESNDFESGLVYVNNPGSWATATGLTGTCARVAVQGLHYLESAAFDGTLASVLSLDFDQSSNVRTGGYNDVEYSIDGGTNWVQVYHATTSTTVSPHITLPNVSNNMKIRFIGNITRSTGQTGNWLIDNVVVYGPQAIDFDWMTLDGGTSTSGTVTTTGNDVIAVGYDTNGATIVEGDYTANINITAPGSDPVSVPVTMTVGPITTQDPEVPANVVTSIAGSNLVIDWDVSAYATGYDVYSSDDPYGTFTLAASVGTNQYTVAADQAKLFYYIVATNSTKSTPKVTVKVGSAR
ncbi:MAG: hypothetical protein JXR69_05715 [Candidatus Delongbacteria bacterium]|nr:hypothetical protein [Candidatus Delongbacteria bacterium]